LADGLNPAGLVSPRLGVALAQDLTQAM